MPFGRTLIDRASKVCGSDAELARRLDVSRAAISQMRSGKAKVSPELAIELCALLQLDPLPVLELTMVENATPARAERIKAAFGPAVQAGAAAMLLFFASVEPTVPSPSDKRTERPVKRGLTEYTLWRLRTFLDRRLNNRRQKPRPSSQDRRSGMRAARPQYGLA